MPSKITQAYMMLVSHILESIVLDTDDGVQMNYNDLALSLAVELLGDAQGKYGKH